MDFGSMMNNPQVASMMQRLMSDPEILGLMQKPGMLEKMQRLMQDPSSAYQYMQDPDFLTLVAKLQSLQSSGDGSGSAFSSYNPFSASHASAVKDDAVHIHNPGQYHKELKEAGSKLVVVDFTATWCGPCQRIKPVFGELATTYKNKAVFLKVDGDENRELCIQEGVQGFPTFAFYRNQKKLTSFSGADERKLRETVSRYVAEWEEEEAKKAFPFKHFPVRIEEIATFEQMKYELVIPKVPENNSKAGGAALNSQQLADIQQLLASLSDVTKYHQAKFSSQQVQALLHCLHHWPLDLLGPILNTVRMAVLHPNFSQYVQEKFAETGQDLIQSLCQVALKKAEKSIPALLVLRSIANCFKRRALYFMLLSRLEVILDTINGILERYGGEEDIRNSSAALFINLAFLLSLSQASKTSGPLSSSNSESSFEDVHEKRILVLSAIADAIAENGSFSQSPTAAYSALVSIGTLLFQDAELKEIAEGLDILSTLNKLAKRFPQQQKLEECIKEIQQLTTTKQ